MITKTELKLPFKDYGVITIPKGTRTTNQTALGIDPNYNFLDDFSFLPLINGIKQYGLIHDLVHYGLNIPKEYLV